jgi:hypothetical protein
MNSGTGERLSAMPQPASASAPPNINAKDTKTRPTRRFYPAPAKNARRRALFEALWLSTIAENRTGTGLRAAPIEVCRNSVAG